MVYDRLVTLWCFIAWCRVACGVWVLVVLFGCACCERLPSQRLLAVWAVH